MNRDLIREDKREALGVADFGAEPIFTSFSTPCAQTFIAERPCRGSLQCETLKARGAACMTSNASLT